MPDTCEHARLDRVLCDVAGAIPPTKTFRIPMWCSSAHPGLCATKDAVVMKLLQTVGSAFLSHVESARLVWKLVKLRIVDHDDTPLPGCDTTVFISYHRKHDPQLALLMPFEAVGAHYKPVMRECGKLFDIATHMSVFTDIITCESADGIALCICEWSFVDADLSTPLALIDIHTLSPYTRFCNLRSARTGELATPQLHRPADHTSSRLVDHFQSGFDGLRSQPVPRRHEARGSCRSELPHSTAPTSTHQDIDGSETAACTTLTADELLNDSSDGSLSDVDLPDRILSAMPKLPLKKRKGAATPGACPTSPKCAATSSSAMSPECVHPSVGSRAAGLSAAGVDADEAEHAAVCAAVSSSAGPSSLPPGVPDVPPASRAPRGSNPTWAVPGGFIVYDIKQQSMAAHCMHPAHRNQRNPCRLNHTCKGKDDGPQGRPLGKLLAWLLVAGDHADRTTHHYARLARTADDMHALRFEARHRARTEFGSQVEAACLERPARVGEGAEPFDLIPSH